MEFSLLARVLLLLTLTLSPLYGSDQSSVLIAILARNKAHVLPRYLECIKNLDYDKKLITIYINTNNNQDQTCEILKEWVRENKKAYHAIHFEEHEISQLSATNPHQWNATRFKVLGALRNKSLQKTSEYDCDYYFVVDCDNFVTPPTLKTLVSKRKPIIAPLLRTIPEANDQYTNFFYEADERGYFRENQNYFKIMNREMVGTFKVDVVHCTYLVDRKCIDKLNYIDGTGDYEFIIFSRSARKNKVEQYICNELDFGTNVHFHENVTQEEEDQKLQEYFRVNI